MNPLALAAVNVVTGFIDKFVADKDEAEKLKANIALEAMKADNEELKAATSVILAEANGESWLQRNWRPLLMLWFAGLVGAHWLGYTPAGLGEETVLKLLKRRILF